MRSAGSGIEAGAGEARDGSGAAAGRLGHGGDRGAAGLRPTLAAVERGATVALANKECLVCAGALFMRARRAAGATILPVDSEHNAIFQALTRGRREDVRRVILTASGGPFRTGRTKQMQARRRQQASRIRTGRWA